MESCKGVWSVNVNENENVIEKDLLPRTSAGLGAERANEVWKKENKNYLNASQGGGYGAEYGNNTIDLLGPLSASSYLCHLFVYILHFHLVQMRHSLFPLVSCNILSVFLHH